MVIHCCECNRDIESRKTNDFEVYQTSKKIKNKIIVSGDDSISIFQEILSSNIVNDYPVDVEVKSSSD